jgi:hypothetical protein
LGAILGQITKAGASKSTGAAAGGIDLGSVLGAIAGGGKGLDLGDIAKSVIRVIGMAGNSYAGK